MRHEHINTCAEIVAELRRSFEVVHATYYPLRIPCIHLNLVVGLTLRAKAKAF